MLRVPKLDPRYDGCLYVYSVSILGYDVNTPPYEVGPHLADKSCVVQDATVPRPRTHPESPRIAYDKSIPRYDGSVIGYGVLVLCYGVYNFTLDYGEQLLRF